MAITDVRIKKVNDNTKVVAKASVTFDNAFVVHGFSIVNGKNGLFVSMPTFKSKYGEYINIAHPITSDGRKEMIKKIMDAYNPTKTESIPFE
jgi:stage V sporulation protein G